MNAFKGDTNICKDLLQHNLNPFMQNKTGDTCLHIAIRRNHFDFVYEIVSWAVRNNITAAQAEVENSAEALTPFMTAALREHFQIGNLLLKNNLATKGYVNREGRDVRQIAEDGDRVRVLAYLDQREIPRANLKRDGSVDTVLKLNTKPIRIQSRGGDKRTEEKPSLTNRKTSSDPV